MRSMRGPIHAERPSTPHASTAHALPSYSCCSLQMTTCSTAFLHDCLNTLSPQVSDPLPPQTPDRLPPSLHLVAEIEAFLHAEHFSEADLEDNSVLFGMLRGRKDRSRSTLMRSTVAVEWESAEGEWCG